MKMEVTDFSLKSFGFIYFVPCFDNILESSLSISAIYLVNTWILNLMLDPYPLEVYRICGIGSDWDGSSFLLSRD